jgi:hypothetical protein
VKRPALPQRLTLGGLPATPGWRIGHLLLSPAVAGLLVAAGVER